MTQELINWLLAGVGGLIGFLLRAVWQAVQDLQTADKELTEKVSSLEVLVAGSYVQKPELNTLATALFTKLDRIEDKLDGKVDKTRG